MLCAPFRFSKNTDNQRFENYLISDPQTICRQTTSERPFLGKEFAHKSRNLWTHLLELDSKRKPAKKRFQEFFKNNTSIATPRQWPRCLDFFLLRRESRLPRKIGRPVEQ